MKRRTQHLILTVITTSAVAIGGALSPRIFAQTAPAISVADAKAADLQQQVTVLNDPSSDTKARDEAARRLVSRGSAESHKALSDVLVNAGNPRGQLSVTRALADAGSTDPAWIDPLFALIGQDRALSDSACTALANYKNNSAVLNRLIEAAQNTRDTRDNARPAVIRALGSFADKGVVTELIKLLQNDAESTAVRNAAADGLVDLTGLTSNGRDLSLWAKWWAVQSAKSDAQFRDDLLVSRSAQADRFRSREEELTAQLTSLLNEQYLAVPDAGKDAQLQKWMQSAEPQVRAFAASKISEDFFGGRRFGAALLDQLRTLVGDSSPVVRLQVARAIRAINDTVAMDALVTQLSQETVPENKAAIALALSRMDDLRSVPELVKLLDDKEPILVTEAGATALANLGAKLYEKDPDFAKQVAARLREVLTNRTEAPGAEHLREAVVEALVPLRDSAMLTTYFKLLNLRESDRTRRASLRGLGELRDHNASDTIVAWLPKEPSPLVRKQAVTALETTSGTEQFETLYQLMQPVTEANADVRAEAWRVFIQLLPQATTQQVNRWPGRFPTDPDKRVVVLKILETKLVQDKNLDELAKTRQNIGETLMKSSPPQAEEAAKYFKQSLEYYQANHYANMVIETNISSLMDAFLQSKQYAEAAEFASKMIQSNQENQLNVGPKFKTEAERLFNSGDLQSAQKLITEANKMQPALEGRYKDMLSDIEKDIHQKLTNQNQKNGTTGPPLRPDVRVG